MGWPAKLKALPKELAAFRRLERLRIENAGFDPFPTVIYDLATLRELHVVNGRIGEFPIGISRMKRLRRISWSQIEIRSLPSDLGKLPALQAFEADRGLLRTFPVEKGDYRALEQLTLKDCQLSTLPDEVGDLPRLRSLNVSGNPLLTEIPPGLATAQKLESLEAERCQLRRIPDELFSLRALEKIDLTDNTFATDEYKALKRLAKAHTIDVFLPRTIERKPPLPAAIADAPLAKSIRKDLDRLGVIASKSEKPPREVEIADALWPVPSALGELLSRSRSGREIQAPFAGSDMSRFSFSYFSSDLKEYECIRHHPYVVIANTPTYFYLLVSLDEKEPADPTLYILDSDESTAHEARRFDRLSAWLKKARPVKTPVRAPHRG